MTTKTEPSDTARRAAIVLVAECQLAPFRAAEAAEIVQRAIDETERERKQETKPQ